ncbi:MAG: hypothetical protein JW814_10260 [Candidatus Krumholzibacteriota bacterium]|nr:hypothetical protein [Candidatus Krumholzibacteriota bacterium]
MKITVIITLSLLLLPRASRSDAAVEPLAALVTKASEYYFKSSSGEERSTLLNDFDRSCQALDSLMGIYMPLDTVSGTPGDERVCRIAQCYTVIGMYENARDWWKVLRRNDDEGIFRMENNRGLLQTGIELADTSLIIQLLAEVELWDSETKKNAAAELLSAIELLYMRGTDIRWLHRRFTRVARFLDPRQSEILRIRLLIRKGEYNEAYEVCSTLVERFVTTDWKAEDAKYLLELFFSSSVLQGRYEDAEDILEKIRIYGCGQLTERARAWEPSISMLKNDRDKAQEQYSQICLDDPSSAGSCFWKDFFVRYKEILSDDRR